MRGGGAGALLVQVVEPSSSSLVVMPGGRVTATSGSARRGELALGEARRVLALGAAWVLPLEAWVPGAALVVVLLLSASGPALVADRVAFRVRGAGPALAGGEQAASDTGASGLAACAYDFGGDDEGDGVLFKMRERLGSPP